MHLAQDDEAGRDPDPTIAIQGLDGRSSRRPSSHRLPAALHGARGPALLGLAVGASVLAALRPWGGGGPDRPGHVVSQRSPLISRSAAGAPAGHAVRTHPPAADPAEVHRRGAVHHQRPRRPNAPASPRPGDTQSEPEREPTEIVAPVSSPVATPPTEAAPGPRPPAAAAPPPPSPSPSSSGDGPGGAGDTPSAHAAEAQGVESFGFEG